MSCSLHVDSHEKLEKQDSLPPIDNVDSGASSSKLFEDQENEVHECGQSMTEDSREEPLGRATKNEDHSFVGNCTVCSKRRRYIIPLSFAIESCISGLRAMLAVILKSQHLMESVVSY